MDRMAWAILWLAGCVCVGFSAVGVMLASHRKKIRIMQEHLHDYPTVKIHMLTGQVAEADMRRRDLQQEVNGTVRNVDRLRQRLEKVEALLDAEKRTDGSEAKLVGLALADRIDALSARMDAVELTCGLREKPKAMGGS